MSAAEYQPLEARARGPYDPLPFGRRSGDASGGELFDGQVIDLTRLEPGAGLGEQTAGDARFDDLDDLDVLRHRVGAAEHIGDLLAHELRNLVMVLAAHAGLLAHSWERLEPGQRRRSADILETETARLGELLTGLVGVSRGQPGHQGPVALAPLVLDALAASSAASSGFGDVLVDCPVGLKGEVNAELVTLVVRNLVDNALVHGRPPVEVTVSRHEDRLTIRVADHGPGVSDAFRPLLFERFTRADQAAPGLGLGMALVSDLVGLHSGTIRYEDRDPSGAVFVVDVPMT